MNSHLLSIGHIKSVYTQCSTCPKQDSAASPPATLVLKQEYLPAIKELRPGQELEIITWLHQSSRETLTCHPRGDTNQPLHGVFATRSPNRPNPLGLHQVRLLGIEKNNLQIHPLDVLDGTPVVDIKPGINHGPGLAWGPGISAKNGQQIRDIARDAWQKGLLSGFNGNLSLVKETEEENQDFDQKQIIITAAGSAKARISPADLVLVDMQKGTPVYQGSMSSETPMHLAVYARQPRARAILHTHPPNLLALWLKNREKIIQLPLYELSLFLPRLTRVGPLAPGSRELAKATGEAAIEHEAIFLENHGLVCWADTLSKALALSEELDSLAAIQLRAGL